LIDDNAWVALADALGVKLHPGHPDYPRRLYHLENPPPITLSGPLAPARIVAIVGSRSANEKVCAYAFSLGYHLGRAGVTVVSGGAVGVDRAAHEGALEGGGTTWLVSPAGRGEFFPEENKDLFERIEASETSRIIWPFDDGKEKDTESPRKRNLVLVGLAECVVVIQAAAKSGSLNAATHARHLGRPIWVVPGPPNDPDFHGSIQAGVYGAEAFWSIQWFFHKLELPPPDMDDPSSRRDMVPLTTRIPKRTQLRLTYGNPSRAEVDPKGWSDTERAVFSVLSPAPTQQDTIITRSGLSASSTLTALLTLSLKDVVVEGPDGFFRRRVSA
jgi:DNA processing protein